MSDQLRTSLPSIISRNTKESDTIVLSFANFTNMSSVYVWEFGWSPNQTMFFCVRSLRLARTASNAKSLLLYMYKMFTFPVLRIGAMQMLPFAMMYTSFTGCGSSLRSSATNDTTHPP